LHLLLSVLPTEPGEFVANILLHLNRRLRLVGLVNVQQMLFAACTTKCFFVTKFTYNFSRRRWNLNIFLLITGLLEAVHQATVAARAVLCFHREKNARSKPSRAFTAVNWAVFSLPNAAGQPQ